MRIRLPLPLILPLAAFSLVQLCTLSARATPEACFEAAVDGQKLRDAGQLLAAREQFIACAKSTCPEEVQKDCTRWLSELDVTLPTVVFGARDADGNDLLDVHVSVDSMATTGTAAGKPVPLDPGAHLVRFDREGSAPVEQSLVVRAGEKNRVIIATFTDVPSSRIPTESWIFAGVGVVGLSVFGVFGARGLSDYHHYGCDQGCNASDKSKVDTQFRVADIGLAIGASALVAATVIWLVRPSNDKASVGLALTPSTQGGFSELKVSF